MGVKKGMEGEIKREEGMRDEREGEEKTGEWVEGD